MAIPRVTLPNHFVVLVDDHSTEEVQKTLLMLGFRWTLVAPPGKGSPETRSATSVRKGPHIAIRCQTFSNDRRKMTRIVARSRLRELGEKGVAAMGSRRFLELLRQQWNPLANTDIAGSLCYSMTPTLFLGEQSSFVMKTRKNDAIFNWRNPMVKTRTQTWKFESRHAADIDFIKIAADLSYAHPFALVKPAGAKGTDEVWLVCNYKLLLKARLIDEQPGLLPDVRIGVRHLLSLVQRGYPVRNGSGDYVTRVSLDEVSTFVESAGEVKALPWPAGDDKKTRTIEVTTLKV